MENIVTEKEYEIQYYEIDYNKKLLLTSLMNYLGDISTKQSEDIGVGLEYMSNRGIAWVLYKWSIHIKRYPSFREKIRVRTTPRSFRKFYANRSFELIDSQGNTIAVANSIWFLISVEKRKAMRITEDMYKAYGMDKKDTNGLDIKKINQPQRIDNKKAFNVRYSDIDTNKHVNNVKYVDWAVETVPLDIVLNYILTDIDIAYEKETTYGEIITVLTEINKENNRFICLHKIVDRESRQLALLETIWVKKG